MSLLIHDWLWTGSSCAGSVQITTSMSSWISAVVLCLQDDILQTFYLYPIFFILPTPPMQCSLSLRGNGIDVRLGLVLNCHLPSVLLTAYCYYRITAYFWRQQKPQMHRKQEAQISWNFLSDSSFSHYLKVLCKQAVEVENAALILPNSETSEKQNQPAM